MFSWFKSKPNTKKNDQTESPEVFENMKDLGPIKRDLEKNLDTIKHTLDDPPDLIIRRFTVKDLGKKAAIVALDGLVHEEHIMSNVLQPLMENRNGHIQDLESIENEIIHALDTMRVHNTNELLEAVLYGQVVLLLDTQIEAIKISAQNFDKRNVEEPELEISVIGPREGFTEVIGTNLTLIRRKLVNPHLRFDMITIGKETKTKICVAYLENVVDQEIVDLVIQRIHKIEIDGVFDSGYVEQLIEDASKSIFPTVSNTEKPDRLCAKLLEGRVGIIVNGTPMALTVPYLFVEGFQSAEDYYSRPYYASLVRMIRFLAFWLAISLPAYYIAVQNFHKEMIPTELLASISGAREGVPLPLSIETVVMLVVFEIMREAGVRMPRAVGQAVSIVGALILGEASVQAGFVGAPTVIVVATVGIATFAITPFTDASTILRFALIIPATFIGLYGVLLGQLILIIHLASLKSFRVPYLAPIAPTIFREWKEVFVRVPFAFLGKSMQSVPQKKERRIQQSYRFYREQDE